MTVNFANWSERIRRLHGALAELVPLGDSIGVPSPSRQEWLELLKRKLLPQVNARPLLVVAVVGGTNIGKSLLFNLLAGEVASGVSPLAAGTKHPVCLVPPDASDPRLLATIFEEFAIHDWRSPADALEDSTENRMFWRIGKNVPPRLVLLDAPDIDSDVKVNWDRARAIRQAADVLLAVLTQQKYNDAAVKQFFREAVRADKPIVIVFNQCDIQADRAFWPIWLDTFCSETGARPELVYVAPHDRAAAESLRLPLYEVGADGKRPPDQAGNLRDELASLHFDEIKVRTMRGALRRVLDAERGLPAYLSAICAAAAECRTAHETLSSAKMAQVAWPAPPTRVLVDEIRYWWNDSRPQWARNIHGFYRGFGNRVARVIDYVWRRSRPGDDDDPLAKFHRYERDAVMRAVENMRDELTRLSTVGNATLRPRLQSLLGGAALEDLLQRVEAAHRSLPDVDEDYRRFLRAELDAWREQNPPVVRLLRSLDNVAAVARPAISVLLFVSGWHLAGDLAGQAAAQAATHTVGQLAQEAAIAGGTAVGGDALVSTTAKGARHAAARLFVRLQSRYVRQRAEWLAGLIERELLGSLLDDLRRGAEVPRHPAFLQVAALAESLA